MDLVKTLHPLCCRRFSDMLHKLRINGRRKQGRRANTGTLLGRLHADDFHGVADGKFRSPVDAGTDVVLETGYG